MAEILNRFFTDHFVILSIVLLFLTENSFAAFPTEKKTFGDCRRYENPKFFGGEICGSDGITYPNTLFLGCVNRLQSKDVGTSYYGRCRKGADHCEPNLIYSPVCGTDNKSWSNFQSLVCHNHLYSSNILVKKVGRCEEVDYCNRDRIDEYGINPVCGSNGFTYQNIAQAKCAQKNNTGLRIVRDGGCPVSLVYQLYGSGTRICRMAQNLQEWNPICASDNKTYANPFVFLCHQRNLRVQFNGACGTSFHQACAAGNASEKRVNGESIDDDLTRKDVVCGNDGRTYKTANHIMCHSLDNKYLYQMHRGRCLGPNDNPCSAVPDEDARFPVCGTDGVTYVSPEALWCVKRRSPERELAYLHDGMC